MVDESVEAIEPKLVVEVTSPSTGLFDRTDKLEEYKTVASIDYILLIDADLPQVRLYWREAGGAWNTIKFIGLDASVTMPKLDVVLTLAEMYEGLAFRPRPQLVIPDGSPSISAK
jgi:Uma2 family endonuclease